MGHGDADVKATPTQRKTTSKIMTLWTGETKLRRARPAHGVFKATFDEAEIQRLLSLQRNVTAQVQRAFLEAINAARDQIDTQVVVRYLEAGDVSGAINYVNDSISPWYGQFAEAVSQAAIAAGIDMANNHPVLGATEFEFGEVNPQTISNLATYDFDLITGLTDTERLSIAQIIRDGVEEGENPLNIAVDIRDFLGLTPRQQQAVWNYQSDLEEGYSSALGRALRDRRFDSTVRRAIDGEDVLSADQIERMVGRYTERQLKSRAETIARTEGMRAVNRGALESWKQAVEDGVVDGDQVVKFWFHSHDDKVRDSHLGIPDLNPDGVGIDEPFETELGNELMYPGDPTAPPEETINCRCCVLYRYVTPGTELPGLFGLTNLFGLASR